MKKSTDKLLLPPGFGQDNDTPIEPTVASCMADQSTVRRHDDAPAEATEFNLKDVHVPGYELLQPIGQGGMGSVFLATDQKLQRQVAIKVLSQPVSQNSKLAERFAVEAKAIAALNHSGIASLYDADVSAKPPYLVMEYVDGKTLEERLQQNSMPIQQIAELICEIAKAVEYCHQQGIIHRDIKPSNVLLDAQDQPKLADFGLAKSLQQDSQSTRTGEIVGTPGYMAPEQASGVSKGIGPACDVYGLGAVLYRMLTGRPPFYSSEPFQTVMMVLAEDPIAPRRYQRNIPRDLETICLKCLAKKPAKRFASVQELIEDLQRFIAGKPIVSRPVSPIERAVKWCKRRPAIALATATLLLAIPLTIAGLWYHNSQLDQALSQKNSALQESERSRKQAKQELNRSEQLANEGSNFSQWIVQNHLDQLRGLNGSTKVQLQLVEKLKSYLDAATPHMPADIKFLRRHAQSYVALADVQGNPGQPNLGQLERAQKNYELAAKLYRQAQQVDPQDVKNKKLLANCLIKMADTIAARTSIKQAASVMKEAELIVKVLATNDVEVAILRARILQYRVEKECIDDQPQKAKKSLDEMQAVVQAIQTDDAFYQKEKEHLGIWIQQQLATVLERLSKFDESIAAVKKAIALAKAPYERQPVNPRFAERYASILVSYADTLFQQRKPEKAMPEFQKVLDIRQSLAKKNPQNIDAQSRLATVHSRIASVYAYQGKVEPVLRHAQLAVKIRRQILKRQPDSRLYQRNLAFALNSVGQALALQKKPDEAEKVYLEQIGIVKKLNQIDSPERVDVATLAQCEFNLAMVDFARFWKDTDNQELWNRVKSCTEFPTYQDVMQHFDDALSTYRQLAKRGTLNRNDKNYQETILATRKQLIENAAKLDKLMKKNQQPSKIDI